MPNHRSFTTRIPGHCLHRASGRGRVRIDGKDHYTGTWGTPEAEAEYRRLIRELLGRVPSTLAEELHDAGSEIAVEDLLAAFWEDAKVRYRDPETGRTSKELAAFKIVLRHLRQSFADLPARQFGPLKLRLLQRKLIDADLTRKTINQHVKRAVRIFKWGVGRELLPASAWHSLRAVEGVTEKEVKTKTRRVQPVPAKNVLAILPHVSPQVAAMVQLQLLTGARPGEIVTMRPGDVRKGGPHGCWVYRPARHKTEHHGHERVIFLGPRAQEILEPYLKGREATAPCFSPAEAEKARNAAKVAARKVKLHLGYDHRRRRKPKPKRQPKEHYTVDSYRRAIVRACDKAKVPTWHPHQLRHSAATELRAEFGVETAQVALGHRNVNITEVYAEKNLDAVARAIAKVG